MIVWKTCLCTNDHFPSCLLSASPLILSPPQVVPCHHSFLFLNVFKMFVSASYWIFRRALNKSQQLIWSSFISMAWAWCRWVTGDTLEFRYFHVNCVKMVDENKTSLKLYPRRGASKTLVNPFMNIRKSFNIKIFSLTVDIAQMNTFVTASSSATYRRIWARLIFPSMAPSPKEKSLILQM